MCNFCIMTSHSAWSGSGRCCRAAASQSARRSPGLQSFSWGRGGRRGAWLGVTPVSRSPHQRWLQASNRAAVPGSASESSRQPVAEPGPTCCRFCSQARHSLLHVIYFPCAPREFTCSAAPHAAAPAPPGGGHRLPRRCGGCSAATRGLSPLDARRLALRGARRRVQLQSLAGTNRMHAGHQA